MHLILNHCTLPLPIALMMMMMTKESCVYTNASYVVWENELNALVFVQITCAFVLISLVMAISLAVLSNGMVLLRD